MNKLLIVLLIVLLSVGGYLCYEYYRSGITGNVSGNEIQRVTISFKDYNYYPRTITVKSGIPVEITLDGSVGGCFRSFNIRALGISQYSISPTDKIVFTPNQKGTFEFACGMRMGYGTIIVE